jgi:hypothetical protein
VAVTQTDRTIPANDPEFRLVGLMINPCICHRLRDTLAIFGMYTLKKLLNRSGPGVALNAEHRLQIAKPVVPSTREIPFPPRRPSGSHDHPQPVVGHIGVGEQPTCREVFGCKCNHSQQQKGKNHNEQMTQTSGIRPIGSEQLPHAQDRDCEQRRGQGRKPKLPQTSC